MVNKDKIYLTSIAILLLILRIPGIGDLTLSTDEYYIAMSVKSITENGLPDFITGGYYTRGLLFQYLASMLVISGLKLEFSIRIISILSQLASLFVLYKIGKRYLPSRVTWTILLLFTISVWQIEFARFGRMYSLLQFTTILYFYYLLKMKLENRENSEIPLIAISLVTVFIHEFGIFFCTLNLLLVIYKSVINKKIDSKYLFISLCVLIASLLFVFTDFRTMGQSNLFPNELIQNIKQKSILDRINLPGIIVIDYDIPILGLLLYLISVIALMIFTLKKLKGFDKKSYLLNIFYLVLSILNLYGLLIFSIFFFSTIFKKSKDALPSKKIILPILIIFLFQLIIISAINFHDLALLSSVKNSFKYLINYPNFYELFSKFRDVYFIYTFIFIISLVSVWIKFVIQNNEFERNLFLFFLSLILLTLLIKSNYFSTRYFFYLYPVAIILVSLFINSIKLKNKAQFINIAIVAVIIIISEDFRLNHLIKINSYENNYRVGMTPQLKQHLYPRFDVKSISRFLDHNMRNEENVISEEITFNFYSKVNFKYYISMNMKKFKGISTNYGKIERWSGKELIYSFEDLVKTISSSSEYNWLIVNNFWPKPENEIQYLEQNKKYITYTSPDSSLTVYKIKTIFKRERINE